MSEIKNSEIMETVKNNITKGLEQFDQEAIRRGIEIWRPIAGYSNYAVSSIGNVKNVKTGKTLKRGLINNGYCIVYLYRDGIGKYSKIHRLVAIAFIANPNNKPCVDHINNVKTDNNVTNLRFATMQENSRNASLSSKNTSGIKGVMFNKQLQKWNAYIQINGRKKHIGYYNTLEEAKVARQIKSKEFGEFQNQCEKS